MKNILVTGGAGFIGSNFVRRMIAKYSDYNIVMLDKLTYAGNLDNLLPVNDSPRYAFEQGDIAHRATVERVIEAHGIDTIVNFAAESHVDRSILQPDAFIHTDVVGLYILLDVARQKGVPRMHHVSTDEVYGSIEDGFFNEDDRLEPNSPYAASKAGGEMMVRAYNVTYGLHTSVTRGSNTFGPYQYPEKIAPFFITEAIDDRPLPLYGDGMQVRDWLYVDDHCDAIDAVLHRAEPGAIYNVGGEHEMHNIDVTRFILTALGKPDSLIRHVEDRPGHDRRYALTNDKIRAELGWEPQHTFADAMAATVRWYRENEWWWRKIKTGEYLEFYKAQYAERLANSTTTD
jgi:dTDP-glucose 4,6-dehydratase